MPVRHIKSSYPCSKSLIYSVALRHPTAVFSEHIMDKFTPLHGLHFRLLAVHTMLTATGICSILPPLILKLVR
ncbi:hypothetical protein HMPREF3212_02405 [Citrobacter freundii]|nr:hypothetical protein HMPREF3212_02405 [Citrobacter freundii]